jgi:N-acetylmuramoyl-L-alanine amidase
MLFKVIAGSFKSRKNADERAAFLRTKGIESYIAPTTVSGETWFRVQTGAFSSRENAEQLLEKVKSAGITDAFMMADNTVPVPADPTTILGPTILSAEKMDKFVKIINPAAIEVGTYYEHLGKYYGIRADVAFAQALLETNFFRFTGVVRANQNNYAGIGATGGDVRGSSFSTPEEGVLAHLQHLFAYATTNSLPADYPLIDPRFHLVKRGSAPKWTDLNGKWAVPGDTYGQSILSLYERMVAATA